MINFLDGLDYLKDAVYREDLTLQSVVWVKLEFPNCSKVLVTNKISKEKNVKLLTDDFTLVYNGADTVQLEVDNIRTEYIKIDISEEWFFQQSCVNNYSSLELADIQFLVEVYKRIMEG